MYNFACSLQLHKCVYKVNYDHNYWDNKTGVITGYAHQDETLTYLANTQMTTLPIPFCNQILDEELEDIEYCKFLGCVQLQTAS